MNKESVLFVKAWKYWIKIEHENSKPSFIYFIFCLFSLDRGGYCSPWSKHSSVPDYVPRHFWCISWQFLLCRMLFFFLFICYLLQVWFQRLLYLTHYSCTVFAVLLVKTSKQVTMSGKNALQFSFLSLACYCLHISLEICRLVSILFF